jgi:hypothetical protein
MAASALAPLLNVRGPLGADFGLGPSQTVSAAPSLIQLLLNRQRTLPFLRSHYVLLLEC